MVNILATRLPELAAAVPFYGAAPRGRERRRDPGAAAAHVRRQRRFREQDLAGYEAALKAAGKRYEAHRYPGTQHGFNNDTTPRFDAGAAGAGLAADRRFLQPDVARLSVGDRVARSARPKPGRRAQCRSRRRPLNAFGLMTLPSRSLAERRARRIASLVSRRARSSAAGQATSGGRAAARARCLAQRGVDAGAPARAAGTSAGQQQQADDDHAGGEDLLDDVHDPGREFVRIVARFERHDRRLGVRHPPTPGVRGAAQNEGEHACRGCVDCGSTRFEPMDEPTAPLSPDAPAARRGRAARSSRRPTTPRKTLADVVDDAVPTPLVRDAADGRPRRLGRQHRRAAGLLRRRAGRQRHGVRRRHAPVGRARERARARSSSARRRCRCSRSTRRAQVEPRPRLRHPAGQDADVGQRPPDLQRPDARSRPARRGRPVLPHPRRHARAARGGDRPLGCRRRRRDRHQAHQGARRPDDRPGPRRSRAFGHAALGDRHRHGRLGAAGRRHAGAPGFVHPHPRPRSSCRPRTARSRRSRRRCRPTSSRRRCARCSPTCAPGPGATSATTSGRRSCAASPGA